MTQVSLFFVPCVVTYKPCIVPLKHIRGPFKKNDTLRPIAYYYGPPRSWSCKVTTIEYDVFENVRTW